MNSKIFIWSLVSALAGFLFGFDTVVISGAEQQIQSLWNLSPSMHGIVMGSALYGTVIGSLFGGIPTEVIGRKKTLVAIGIFYFVSAVGCAFAHQAWVFVLARFVGGLGIGASTVTAPLYISEISPPDKRGRLAGMFQFNIVFGILIAFLSNWLLKDAGENSWRWMMGISAAPTVIYVIATFIIPESPRWLLARGRTEQARNILQVMMPQAKPSEINDTASAICFATVESSRKSKSIFSAALLKPTSLAFFIAFFNQLSGINAILYFAPRIFGLTGSENALAQSIGIGVTNLLFTFVGLWLIDRLGRRTLLFIGSYGYIVSLGLCAIAFFTWAPQFKAASAAVDVKAVANQLKNANSARVPMLTNHLNEAKNKLEELSNEKTSGIEKLHFSSYATSEEIKAQASMALEQASKAAGFGGTMVLLCIFAFIASHAVGQGAVIWVFISEIFPNQCRAAGQSFGSATHWVFAALLTTIFPIMMVKIAPGVVFLIFTFMMVLQLAWVKFMMPETKGVALEDVEKNIIGH